MTAILAYAVLFAACVLVVYLYRKLYREIRDSKRPWWTK